MKNGTNIDKHQTLYYEEYRKLLSKLQNSFIVILAVIATLTTPYVSAQESDADSTIFPLYGAGTVSSLDVPESKVLMEDMGETLIFNVSNPTLEIFTPDPKLATGAAVIIAPGGGFVALTYEQGGTAIARQLSKYGITALVLKYRTIQSSGDPMRIPKVHQTEMDILMERIKTGMPVDVPEFAGEAKAIEDGTRAMQIVRQNASAWGIDPDRVGMLGMSAGAFIAADLAIGEKTSRPNFVGLLYGGLRSPVPADASPAFIAAAADDEFLATDSLRLFTAFHAAGVPTELHMYENGGHGFDLRMNDSTSDEWFTQFIKWMKVRKLI